MVNGCGKVYGNSFVAIDHICRLERADNNLYCCHFVNCCVIDRLVVSL